MNCWAVVCLKMNVVELVAGGPTQGCDEEAPVLGRLNQHQSLVLGQHESIPRALGGEEMRDIDTSVKYVVAIVDQQELPFSPRTAISAKRKYQILIWSRESSADFVGRFRVID
jgi:hypothetical protein